MPNLISATPDRLVQRFADALQQAGFSGEVESQLSSRLTFATDNSIYFELPQGILFPKDINDVQLIMRTSCWPQFRELKFAPRGGGTGTNGQSLTAGVVIDLSRHMNCILELDLAQRRVRVEAGVVKDALNDFLRPHGLFFSPDLSTSNRAVIGGMISTDASGQGSLRYGKTSDHVLGLGCVLSDGEYIETRPLSIDEAAEKAMGDGVEARAYEQLFATYARCADEIEAQFPDLNRFLTGYDLKHAVSEDSVDLTRLLCGSEGTLGVITDAWLDLDEISVYRTLVNISYDSFDAALRAAPMLLQAKALSVETIDSTVLNLARADVIWDLAKDSIDVSAGDRVQGLNIVEFAGDNDARQQQQITALTLELDAVLASGEGGVCGYRISRDLAEIQKVYDLRKKSVGLLGNMPGAAKPVPFVEDSCVRPEQLADYILEFRALLDRHQLRYGMFGHVDCGVLHVRPALDMLEPKSEVLVRDITDEVVSLTKKYGGILWGEHGRGYRSEYGALYFGESLYAELRKIKLAFDPENRLNPGKICTPLESSEQLVSVDAFKRGAYDRNIPPVVRAAYAPLIDCNGNGLCFNYNPSAVMCPSYKGTGDRRHSPKGRATVLREWLRQKGGDVLSAGDKPMPVWRVLRNQLKWGRAGDTVFAAEVAGIMRGCLACKACTAACPVHVDIATFRSQFLHHYHTKVRRPLSDFLVAGVEYYAPLMASFNHSCNRFLRSKPGAWVMQKVGMVDAPMLSDPTLRQRTHHEFDAFDFDALRVLSPEERAHTVIVVQDPFTSYYEAGVVHDLMLLLRQMGYAPVLLPFRPNGKPMYVKGFLGAFASLAQRNARFLNQLAALGIDMVGVDPALVLCYRDEYKRALREHRGEFRVKLIQEWLLTHLPGITANASGQRYTLLPHCTERSLEASAPKDWKRIFAAFGLALEVPDSGCCGMSGSYGHESQHKATSRKIFSLDWQQKIERARAEGQEVLATGYSCRSQAKRLAGQSLRHPLQALLQSLREHSLTD